MSTCLVTVFIIHGVLHLEITEEKMILGDHKMNMSSKWDEKPNVILGLLNKVCSIEILA